METEEHKKMMSLRELFMSLIFITRSLNNNLHLCFLTVVTLSIAVSVVTLNLIFVSHSLNLLISMVLRMHPLWMEISLDCTLSRSSLLKPLSHQSILLFYPILRVRWKFVQEPSTVLTSIGSADVRLFFESLCGEVYRLKMLGDHHHFSQIAFVEFVMAESATAALNCSGALLGTLPIRVSPSKTPVRPRARRTTTR